MAFDYSTLIIDRAASDSDALRALVKKPMSQWTAAEAETFTVATLKGSYDYTDLNRVSACMEDLVARLNGLGYQVPGYERVKIERAVKPDGVAKLRYLRMTITALRENTNVVQMSEIRILSKNGSVMEWPQGTTVTASINATGDGESPDKLIDGSTDTKFCSAQFVSGMQINIDLGNKILDRTEYTAWQWFTANDAPERDPVTFELSGSADGQTFTVMDSASNVAITETRKILAYSGSIGVLPNGFTEVAYIQSSGTQYTDTGFKPNQDTRVVMDAQMTSNNVPVFYFGTRPTGTSVRMYNVLNTSSGIRSDYGTSQVAASGLTATNRMVIDKNKNICSMGTSSVTNTSSTFQTTFNLFLFASNDGGNPAFYGSLRLFACQIYDNGTLVRDYVPCKNADNAVGLYDLVGGQFYGNAGTGSFTVGDVVESASESDTEELDPYTWYKTDSPTRPQMEQYRGNVAAVRAVLAMPDTTPEVPESLRKPTTDEVNTIESILVAIDLILTHIPAARRHCGVTVCGLKGVIA